ncbi:MAG TPA: hypothetical protein VF116_15875 [Ktedonobacterales bacterium]
MDRAAGRVGRVGRAQVQRRAAVAVSESTAKQELEPELELDVAPAASADEAEVRSDTRVALDSPPDAATMPHEEADGLAPEVLGVPEITRVGYAPIVRVDAARREIELCATSEAVDSYGTVFDYQASKAAFARWIGNVREMHARRAVGRRVAVRYDDGARRVYVRVRISAGAHDTWEKIGDGTLRGASIGASNVAWTFQTRRVAGRDQVVQVATAYELVELSLVDNPSNPDALGITIVRAAAPVEALLAELDDTAVVDGGTEGAGPRGGDGDTVNAEGAEVRGGRGEGAERFTTEETEGTEERAERGTAEDAEGAKDRRGFGGEIEKAGRQAVVAEHDSAHDPRDEKRPAQRARGPFSGNPAGVPDMGVPERAPEPAPSEAGMPAAGNARERFHAAARGILLGCGCGLCEAALAALGSPDAAAVAGAMEERAGGSGTSGTVREAALARAVAAGLAAEARQVERMEASVRALGDALHAAMGGMGATLDTSLGDLRTRLERIEAQPLPGGPALRAVEKSHALAPAVASHAAPVSPAEQYRALEALAGKLSDPQAQIAVAAELIRLRAREGR